jgi:hypothetical protein
MLFIAPLWIAISQTAFESIVKTDARRQRRGMSR